MKVHSTRHINFTKRAEVITLLCNCYRFLFPKSKFTDMAEYLGISKSGAHRYFYGLNHGYNLQTMRKGSNVIVSMNKDFAIKTLSKIDDYKKKYDF